MKLFRSILLGKFNVIFIQRYIFSPVLPLEIIFRLFFKKKIVIDFDDVIYLRRPKRYSYVVRNADRVIVGNTFLAEYAKKFNNNVSVIPTAVDTNLYFPQKEVNKGRTLSLGWIGSPSGLYMLEPLYNAFRKLAASIDYQLVVVSDFQKGSKVNIPGVKVINRQWSEGTELADLNSFDIGLMPLFKDSLSEGKCSYKAIQYMAVGIPAVISAVGNNKKLVNDGLDGFLYETEDEFVEKILYLAKNDQKRHEMGRLARRKVEEQYATCVLFKNFCEAIKY